MLPLIPIFLLLFSALMLVILAGWRPDFRYQWLVAVGGTVLAWGSMLILRIRLPHKMTLLSWNEQERFFNESPALLVDEISWSFGLALVSLALAIILTDVWRATEERWDYWARSLAVAGLGIFAVFSSNFLTLVLTWLLIDVLELIVILTQVADAKIQRGAVLYLSTSLLGTFWSYGLTQLPSSEGIY